MLSIIPLILLPLQTLSCGEVSDTCATLIDWAVDVGSKEHPEWYAKFNQVTGGSLAHASIEDMELYFYCEDKNPGPPPVVACVNLERPCGRQCGISGKDTFYDYPSCKPDCLFNNGGCPGGVPCHQIIDAVYRVDGKCYKALSNCWGCLKDTSVSGVGTQLEAVACPTPTFGYDPLQASEVHKHTLSGVFDKCQTKCEESGGNQLYVAAGGKWGVGMFSCDDSTSSWWSCTCRKCQRHECSIEETGYETSKCDIDTIKDRSQDLKSELSDLAFDFAANSAGMIPVVGFAVTEGMNTAKGAYGISQNDEHDVMNGVIADINRQAVQLKDCMDEKIEELEAAIISNAMQNAWLLFDIAAGYDGDDFDDLMSDIKVAWTEHLKVANSQFDDIDGKSTTYFKKLLLPLQAFVQTFAQVSVDYLKNLYAFEPAVYPDAYFRTIQCFESFKKWSTAALDIISKDMDTKSHQIACQDGKGLAAGLEKWKIAFAIANIDPIESYIVMIESMNGLFELEN